ncbi:MAG: hypothetical protein MZV64_35245 [Ignavibacteriales bacterium]|nr:hypothetical protein [Ignavibacteriales bacterium]
MRFQRDATRRAPAELPGRAPARQGAGDPRRRHSCWPSPGRSSSTWSSATAAAGWRRRPDTAAWGAVPALAPLRGGLRDAAVAARAVPRHGPDPGRQGRHARRLRARRAREPARLRRARARREGAPARRLHRRRRDDGLPARPCGAAGPPGWAPAPARLRRAPARAAGLPAGAGGGLEARRRLLEVSGLRLRRRAAASRCCSRS